MIGYIFPLSGIPSETTKMVVVTISFAYNVNRGCGSDLSFMTQYFFSAYPEKLGELIRRDYKGAVLCPFPWCEDELQLGLSNIFTRLKIISKEKERARLTEDIVNMTDVFKPHVECNKPRVVLIEGQPGMGKTTYCQKLAYDWSVEDISPEASFPKVEMMLLLKCRDMKTVNIEEAIDDQLLPQDADKKEKENFFQYIRSNQSRTLLVLDGLDELRDDLFQSFLPLIQGKVFPNAYIMLTARHEAGKKVRRYCDTLLEIVGYTNEDAVSYIKKYFSNHDDPSLANKLIEKLKHDTKLKELTTNPLNTALLCLVCEDTRGVFPSNRSKLYDELVTSVIKIYFVKKDIVLNDNERVETCADQLNELGKMALEALLKDQLAFSVEKRKGQSTDFLEFGFLSQEDSASKIRPKPCYAFTHKTFQEYFAAFHLACQLQKTDQTGRSNLLAQLSPVEKYTQVWKFLVEMLANQSASNDVAASLAECLCDRFFTDTFWKSEDKCDDSCDDGCDDSGNCDDNLNYDNYDDENPDYECWLGDCDDYENRDIHGHSGDPFNNITDMPQDFAKRDVLFTVLYLIEECADGELESRSFVLKMLQTLSHRLAISNLEVEYDEKKELHRVLKYLKSASELTQLRLRGCKTLGVSEAAEIAQVLQQCNCSLASLEIQGSFLPGSGSSVIKTLTHGLHSNHSLKHIQVRYAHIGGDAVAQAFANVLKSSSALEYLDLTGNKIGDSGAAALMQALQLNSTLKYLHLGKNVISDPGEALPQALKSNCTLTFLNLADNRINDSGVAHLVEALGSQCTALTHLGLRGNMIGDSLVQTLAKALVSNGKLTHLDLRKNSIGDAGATSLGNALQSNHQLTNLNLWHNSIGDAGAEGLANALQSNCSLMNVNLSKNCVGDRGAESLARALHSNNNLINLDISYNRMTDSAAEALADALQSNTTLKGLDLSANACGDLGALHLAHVLLSNTTLTFLGFWGNRLSIFGSNVLSRIPIFSGRKVTCSCTLFTLELYTEFKEPMAQ